MAFILLHALIDIRESMEDPRVVIFVAGADVNHWWKLELIPDDLQHSFETLSKLEHEVGADEAL